MAMGNYERAKNNFKAWMDCIEEYLDISAPPKNGQLYFVENSEVAKLVVSKYHKEGIEYFKWFFCKEVLELRGGKLGEDDKYLNFSEYEKYFNGEGKKKYKFSPELLNASMDKDINNKFYKMAFNEEPGEAVLEGVFCPRILIERLGALSHELLKEYFLLDNDESGEYFDKVDEIKDSIKDNEEKKVKLAEFRANYAKKRKANRQKRIFTKEECYGRFVTAVCLYEIFVKKFLGESALKSASNEWKKAAEKIGKLDYYVEQLKAASGTTIEEMFSVSQDMKAFAEQYSKLIDSAAALTERAIYYIAHCKYLTAFAAIITLIEFSNINNGDVVANKIKNDSMNNKLCEGFSEEKDYLFMDGVVMNKNVSELYNQFMENAKREKLLKELCSRDVRIQKKALGLIKIYFEKVKAGQYTDSDFAAIVSQIADKCVREQEEE